MTIAIESNGGKILLIANGTSITYGFNFKILNINDIKVYEDSVLSTGSIQFNLNQDQDASPGGSITYLAGTEPANGVIILIKRIVNLEQQIDYSSYGGFPAETHEFGLDNLTQIVQQLEEGVSRSLLAPIDDDGTTDFTLPGYSARKGFVYDATVKKIILTTNDPDDISAAAAISAAEAAASAAEAAASAAEAAADVLLTNADVVATGNDVAATNQDKLGTAADLAATNQDTLDTAADLAATGVNLAATNQDTLDTAADAGLTASDVVITNNDVLNSNANAQSAFGSKQQALASENQAGLYAAQAGAAAGIIVEHPFILGTSAYSGTLGITSYVIDATYNVVVLQTNTTNASTLNFDGLGPIPIKLLNSGDPYIGAIHEGIVAKFMYDGVNMRLLNPHSSWPTFMSRTTAGPNAVTGPTVVPYDNVQIDTNLNYNNITYRYKPTERGYYMVYAQLRVSGLAISDFVHLSITRDAVNGIPEARSSIIAKDTSAFLKIGPYPMYFDGITLDEVWIVEENQTGTSHAFDSTDAANWFSVTKVSH